MYPNTALYVPDSVLDAPTNGSVILSNLSQFRKANASILVTLSGITMLVNSLHFKNAPRPMLFTPSEISTSVKFTQLENAYSPIRVTLSSIITDVMPYTKSHHGVVVVVL